jgi:hypothetical protein
MSEHPLQPKISEARSLRVSLFFFGKGFAYSSGLFLSKDQPKMPLLRTSGSGAGTSRTSACGGGGGAGKLSHFIE